MDKLIGSWECHQSYEVEGDLFFESSYKVIFTKGQDEIVQAGKIKLSDSSIPTKTSQLSYTIKGKITFIDENSTITQPINIDAQKIEDDLGIITDQFMQDFLNNKKEYKAVTKFIGSNNLKSLFDDGNVVECVRIEL